MGQALRLDPENPGGYKRLAHLFEQLGVTPLALQSLRQAACLDPFDASLAERIDRFSSRTRQDAPAPEPEVDGLVEQHKKAHRQDVPAPEPEEFVASTVPEALEAETPQPQALPPRSSEAHEDLCGSTNDSELLRLLQEIEEEKAAEPVPAPEEPPTPANSEPSAPKRKRIATMTLAEIYTTQGLTQKAIETYRELLEQEPTNTIIRSKLTSLQKNSNAH